MTLAQRRRALMGKKDNEGVPSGYVKNGLVFFLDALQADVDNNDWTDLIGGIAFTLANCTKSQNGVVFNGTNSEGIYAGAITHDWENETIETAITTASSSGQYILSQPGTDGWGISIGLQYVSSTTKCIVINMDGNSRPCFRTGGINGTISVSADTCVRNKIKITNTASTNLRNTGTTYTRIGRGVSNGNKFNGTIHAIRIYNRKLTEAEMLQNQQADIDRYGITI